MDYYNLLGLQKNADSDNIKKQYKKLAKQHHPDRGGDAEKFKNISKAYSVLSDPKKRQIYDQFGEKGLEGGGSFDPMDIFSSFFSNERGPGAHFFTNMNFVRKTSNKVLKVDVELKDLYFGCKKNVQYNRRVFKNTNLKISLEKITINISSGTIGGEKIVCREMADEHPNCITGDLIIVINEISNGKYKRKNFDLYCNYNLSLIDALSSKDLLINHINKKTYKLLNDRILTPYDVIKIPNLGMPIKGHSNRYGELYLRIVIKFPAYLSKEVISQLNLVLPKTIDINNLNMDKIDKTYNMQNLEVINSISFNNYYNYDDDLEDENVKMEQCVHQ